MLFLLANRFRLGWSFCPSIAGPRHGGGFAPEEEPLGTGCRMEGLIWVARVISLGAIGQNEVKCAHSIHRMSETSQVVYG